MKSSQAMHTFLSHTSVCSVTHMFSICCIMFCLRRVETKSHFFAYTVHITSMILRTVKFLCILYAEICVTWPLSQNQTYHSFLTEMCLSTISQQTVKKLSHSTMPHMFLPTGQRGIYQQQPPGCWGSEHGPSQRPECTQPHDGPAAPAEPTEPGRPHPTQWHGKSGEPGKPG